MSDLVPLNQPDPGDPFELLIEVDTTGTGFRRAGIEDRLEQVRKYSEVALNLTTGTIRSAAQHFHAAIASIEEQVRPHEVEVEFGIRLEIQGNLETPQLAAFIAKGSVGGSAGSQFTVKFKWNVEKPDRAKVLVSGQE
mgnify:CR=1 FL=1